MAQISANSKKLEYTRRTADPKKVCGNDLFEYDIMYSAIF
jgi:hypothetical protein